MVETVFLLLFAGIAIFCALNVVFQSNALYSAISLIGVFIGLSCMYLMLASPFIAIVQILVYAGAIMVLVVFVIMLLNVEEGLPNTKRLKYLTAVGAIMGLALTAQAFFIYYAVSKTNAGKELPVTIPTMGLTVNIGKALFTEYILPFEVTGILLLMAIVGAMVMARRLKTDETK